MAPSTLAQPATLLVTGGAGFIGSALVRLLVNSTQHRVVNVDKLTYSGSLLNLPEAKTSATWRDRHVFVHADICDTARMGAVLAEYKPQAILHLAAESHVDRSISGPQAFIEANIQGTFSLLEAARRYHSGLSPTEAQAFRYLHVSTDEVFGTLGDTGYFTETTPYAPNSPYSASKAASDHLARAWHHTYGLPVVMTNCSNNYGPYQFPEKLIPVVMTKALAGQPIPIYGKGVNVRDWLHVDDHVRALMMVLEKGRLGESYNVGCHNDRPNIEVVQQICDILDACMESGKIPRKAASHRSLMTFVTDRAGHDLRYAIDPSKIEREIGWQPQFTFESGLKDTVHWYLDNQAWTTAVQAEAQQKLSNTKG
jgi:dTDP-glucose 4,6-dehydratase